MSAAAYRTVFAVFALLAFLAPVATTPARADDASPPCNAWDVEYALAATVRISDTTMGAGDGVFPIGPGRAVVRFEDKGGEPGGAATLRDYRMRDHFTVEAKVFVAGTKVEADTISTTTPDACGASATGALSGRTLRWSGPWSGMRSDGTVTCTGAFCGKFGAPPAGTSELHVAPHPVVFSPFEYAEDKKTFTMAWSVVSHQESPRQTSRISFAGREIKRTCVVARACP